MLKTLRLKISAYKWTIIVSMFGVMAVALVWQHHRTSSLKTETELLKSENKELSLLIEKNHEAFIQYKGDVSDAINALQTLREDIKEINKKTASLQGQVNTFRRTPVAPDGANAGELEAEANRVTKELFDRIENATKGVTK